MHEIRVPCIDNITRETFIRFKKDVRIHFVTMEYDKQPKVIQLNILKKLMGPDLNQIYNLLKNIKPNEEDINYVFKVLETYFNDIKKNENFELNKFFTRRQEINERFNDFYSSLERLILFCDFGSDKILNRKILKAQIINGIRSKTVKKKIIDDNLSLDDIVLYCNDVEREKALNLDSAGIEDELSDSESKETELTKELEPKLENAKQVPDIKVKFEEVFLDEDPLDDSIEIEVLENESKREEYLVKMEPESSSDDDEPLIKLKQQTKPTKQTKRTKKKQIKETLLNQDNINLAPGFLRLTSKVVNNFKCDICFKEFRFATSFKKHKLWHDEKKDDLQERTCPVCKKVLGTKKTLWNHKKTHAPVKKFICEICSKGFHEKRDLELHIRRHYKDPDVECDICGKKFYRIGEMKYHRITHSNEKPFCCEVCAMTFKTRSNLNNHSIIHTDLRPYKCKYCPKTFKFSSSCKNHELIHRGERNHVCELCSRAFTEKGQLRTHMKTHRKK